jgi:hypothetical protein
MIVKHSEANTKWCMNALVAHPIGTSVNRDRESGAPAKGTHCLGSQCMAWRWYDGSNVKLEDRLGFCGMVVQEEG